MSTKRSESMKRAWQRPGIRAKYIEARNRPETNVKISRFMKENNPMNRLEVRMKQREAVKKALNMPNVKAKESEAKKGEWQRPESRAKRIEAFNRPEVKLKKSEAVKRSWQDSEVRANRIEAMNRPEVKARVTGENNPAKRPENRAKISKLTKKAMNRPETKAKSRESHNTPEYKAKISGENCHLWKGGISFLPYCPKFNKDRKEQVRNNYERTCANCGMTELLNPTRLSVHHVDGDKMQGCKGAEWFGLGDKWFLVPLCHSCHSKALERDPCFVGKFWLAELSRKYWERRLSVA